MKTVDRIGFQGDVGFFRVAKLPKGVTEEKTDVVAHSETGHHHVVRGPEGAFAYFRETLTTAYLTCDVPVEIVHLRQFDTHESIQLPAGIWQVRRQRESTPEGWAMVAD